MVTMVVSTAIICTPVENLAAITIRVRDLQVHRHQISSKQNRLAMSTVTSITGSFHLSFSLKTLLGWKFSNCDLGAPLIDRENDEKMTRRKWATSLSKAFRPIEPADKSAQTASNFVRWEAATSTPRRHLTRKAIGSTLWMVLRRRRSWCEPKLAPPPNARIYVNFPTTTIQDANRSTFKSGWSLLMRAARSSIVTPSGSRAVVFAHFPTLNNSAEVAVRF